MAAIAETPKVEELDPHSDEVKDKSQEGMDENRDTLFAGINLDVSKRHLSYYDKGPSAMPMHQGQ